MGILRGILNGVLRLQAPRGPVLNDLQSLGKMKLGHIAPTAELNSDLLFMAGFVVVLGQPFPNFCGSYANNGIGTGVVVNISLENLQSDGAFLEFIAMTG
jgi:hypothetical protein